MEILGTLGVGSDVDPLAQVWDPDAGEVVPVDLDVEEEQESRTLAEHRGFVAAIGGAEVPLVSFSEAINVQRIIEAIYTSAASGAEVRL